jgi:hypothetical protein
MMRPIVAGLVRLEQNISGVTKLNAFSCRPEPEQADIHRSSFPFPVVEGAVRPNTPLLVSHPIAHHPILP